MMRRITIGLAVLFIALCGLFVVGHLDNWTGSEEQASAPTQEFGYSESGQRVLRYAELCEQGYYNEGNTATGEVTRWAVAYRAVILLWEPEADRKEVYLGCVKAGAPLGGSWDQ